MLDDALKKPFVIDKHLDIVIDKIVSRKRRKEKKKLLEQAMFINPEFMKKKTTKKVSFFDS